MAKEKSNKSLGLPEDEFYGGPPMTSPSSDGNKKRILFPSVTLRNAQVEKAGLSDCEFDEVIDARVKLRVASIGSDEGSGGKSKRLELEIQELTPEGDYGKSRGSSDEPEERDTGNGVIVRTSKRSTLSPKEAGYSK